MSGERVLAGLFGLVGLFFALEARDLSYMEESVPGAGFLPFWLGLLLVALVAGFLFTTRPAKPAGDGASGPSPADRRKVAAVSLGLVACIAAIGELGFTASIAAYLLFLARAVERRGWGLSAGVALGATLGLYLIFQAWLKVPLPRGPWGF
ncbi:MAG TPA: tripartite tricarboxylate transporter TctB family protein [Thermodesulfobacteriota bacterium]